MSESRSHVVERNVAGAPATRPRGRFQAGREQAVRLQAVPFDREDPGESPKGQRGRDRERRDERDHPQNHDQDHAVACGRAHGEAPGGGRGADGAGRPPERQSAPASASAQAGGASARTTNSAPPSRSPPVTRSRRASRTRRGNVCSPAHVSPQLIAPSGVARPNANVGLERAFEEDDLISQRHASANGTRAPDQAARRRTSRVASSGRFERQAHDFLGGGRPPVQPRPRIGAFESR